MLQGLVCFMPLRMAPSVCLWNACGWTDTQRNAHTKKHCVYVTRSRICLMCFFSFICNENLVRGRLPHKGNIKALSYIWSRFCSADGRTQICKVSPSHSILMTATQIVSVYVAFGMQWSGCFETVLMLLDKRWSVNGPCYAIPEVCQGI